MSKGKWSDASGVFFKSYAERNKAIVDAAEKGFRYSLIAKVVGVSVGAVAGAIHRNRKTKPDASKQINKWGRAGKPRTECEQ